MGARGGMAGARIAVIGVTGCMGGGKSTVSAIALRLIVDGGLFGEGMAELFDADAEARLMLAVGGPAYRGVVDTFGESVLGEGGGIDRQRLAEAAFSDEASLRALNALTHVLVAESVYRRIAGLLGRYRGTVGSAALGGRADRSGDRASSPGRTVGCMVLDAPLPVERGFLDVADAVWVVEAPLALRLERIAGRGGISRDDAVRRMGAQMGPEEYRRLARTVIVNDGDMGRLRSEVLSKLKEHFRPDADIWD